jgi:hypothetical protein
MFPWHVLLEMVFSTRFMQKGYKELYGEVKQEQFSKKGAAAAAMAAAATTTTTLYSGQQVSL